MALNSSTIKRPGRQPFALLCLAVALACPAVAHAQGARPAGSAPTQASSTPAAPSAEVEELLLLPTVNEVSESEPRLMLRDRAGQLWLAENDLKGWRIRIPAGEPRVFDGIRYWRLSSIEGASSRLDERALKANCVSPRRHLKPRRSLADAQRGRWHPDQAGAAFCPTTCWPSMSLAAWASLVRLNSACSAPWVWV